MSTGEAAQLDMAGEVLFCIKALVRDEHYAEGYIEDIQRCLREADGLEMIVTSPYWPDLEELRKILLDNAEVLLDDGVVVTFEARIFKIYDPEAWIETWPGVRIPSDAPSFWSEARPFLFGVLH